MEVFAVFGEEVVFDCVAKTWIPAFAGMTRWRIRGNDEMGGFGGMTWVI